MYSSPSTKIEGGGSPSTTLSATMEGVGSSGGNKGDSSSLLKGFSELQADKSNIESARTNNRLIIEINSLLALNNINILLYPNLYMCIHTTVNCIGCL